MRDETSGYVVDITPNFVESRLPGTFWSRTITGDSVRTKSTNNYNLLLQRKIIERPILLCYSSTGPPCSNPGRRYTGNYHRLLREYFINCM